MTAVRIHTRVGTTVYVYDGETQVEVFHHPGPPLPETDYLPDGRRRGQQPPDWSSLPVGTPAPNTLAELEAAIRRAER